MSRGRRPLDKSLFRTFHKWLGLSIALYLVFQSTTGVLLVFRHELQASWSHSERSKPGESVSMQSVLDRLGRSYPRLSVERIYYPKVAGEPYIAHLRSVGGSAVSLIEIDPQNGNLRDASLAVRMLNLVFGLHHELSLGKAGLYVVGGFGLGLSLSAISGLWLWWPGKRRLRNAFRVKLTGAGVRSVYDWHRLTGSVVAPLVIVSAVTGFLLAYGGLLRTAFEIPAVPVLAATEHAAEPPIDVDALIAIAVSSIPNGGVRDLRFDPDNELLDAVVLFGESRHRSRPFDRVWVDPYSGEVRGVSESERLDAGASFFAWLYPTHTQFGLGTRGKALVAAGGIGMLLLSITGPMLWWRKRRQRGRP